MEKAEEIPLMEPEVLEPSSTPCEDSLVKGMFYYC
jgi:hypothetical protein